MMVIMGVAVWAGLTLDEYLHLGFPVFVSISSVAATVLTVYLTVKKLAKGLWVRGARSIYTSKNLYLLAEQPS